MFAMHTQKSRSMSENNALLVIGAGMPRTGTASLKKALEIIFQKPCYHMFELREKHPEHSVLWSKMFKASLILDRPVINHKWIMNIFEEYAAVTDAPTCALYEPLMSFYPKSKIVLTVRDPKVWIQSIRSTVLPKHDRFKNSFITRLVEWIEGRPGFFEMIDNFWLTCLGPNLCLSDDEQMLNAFKKWNTQVQSTVPKDRLLVFDIGSGWEPLCRFLDVPIPNQPFPHVNDRAAFRQHISRIHNTRMLIRIGIFAVGSVLFGLCVHYLNFV